MTQKHTPTPYIAATAISSLVGLPICSSQGKAIGTIHTAPNGFPNSDALNQEALATAAFIVQACNSHDALVEALENLLNANPAFRSMPVGSPGSVARIAQEMAIEAEDAAKAALALAKVES